MVWKVNSTEYLLSRYARSTVQTLCVPQTRIKSLCRHSGRRLVNVLCAWTLPTIPQRTGRRAAAGAGASSPLCSARRARGGSSSRTLYHSPTRMTGAHAPPATVACRRQHALQQVPLAPPLRSRRRRKTRGDVRAVFVGGWGRGRHLRRDTFGVAAGEHGGLLRRGHAAHQFSDRIDHAGERVGVASVTSSGSNASARARRAASRRDQFEAARRRSPADDPHAAALAHGERGRAWRQRNHSLSDTCPALYKPACHLWTKKKTVPAPLDFQTSAQFFKTLQSGHSEDNTRMHEQVG